MTIEQIYDIYLQNPVITTDSRDIPEGSLFFALRGATFNGNDYAHEALKKGARWAVVDDPGLKGQSNCIKVDNCLGALQELASYHRKKTGVKIIAITGSNGKTTTKELLQLVLSCKYKTYATKGNLNNHIGVPLTLLSFGQVTEIGVVEMGANHIGEIAGLCRIASPDFGIITNIGKAHIEGFGSEEGVVKAKSELYEYLAANHGLVFYNADNPLLSKQTAKFKNNTVAYGKNNGTVTGEITEAGPFLKVVLRDKKKEFEVNTNLIGTYNFENILAAASIGKYFGVEMQDIAGQIERYAPDNMRSQFIKKKGHVIILDAYNANPSSMKAALENFHGLSYQNKVLIIGDMMELGNISDKEHKDICEYIGRLGFNEVYLVGDYFMRINTNSNFKCFKNTDELLSSGILQKITNSAFLLKASRSLGLEKIVPYL